VKLILSGVCHINGLGTPGALFVVVLELTLSEQMLRLHGHLDHLLAVVALLQHRAALPVVHLEALLDELLVDLVAEHARVVRIVLGLVGHAHRRLAVDAQATRCLGGLARSFDVAT